MRYLIVFFLMTQAAVAQTTVEITATRDTTLYSESGNLSNGAGPNLFLGITRLGDDRRPLIAFDDLSQIPSGAIITSVELQIRINRAVGGAVSTSVFELTQDWGESTSNAPGAGGMGATAEDGDATWTTAVVPGTPWNTPGGDLAATELTSTPVGNSGFMVFPSTPELVNAVQGWVDGTAPNRGVILRVNSTTTRQAKRLESRENPNASARPQLIVSYEQPTSVTPIAISGLWFDPALDGEGYNVIQSEGATTIFFYGYDSEGNRLWLVTTSVPDEPIGVGNTVIFQLAEGGGDGTFDAPSPSTELSPWGTLEVTMSSCTEGRFVLSGTDGSKTSNVIKLAGIAGTSCDEMMKR
ncbi:MAG: DNRLRE domain-containing protein [Xanthomonadales bacterium]|nr:DNRLRE domain-containing protein [Xanthomonadales bacterium]